MADIRSVIGSSFARNRSDVFVAAGVVAVVMMLIIPLPAVLLDILMSFNLILGLLTILIVLYTRSALEFSIFPTLLLVATVFGLALNVSSTRLILSKGLDFDGRLVRAFGEFVVGGGGTQGLVIGFIIFIMIVAVQFLVITKGATRVAEVAARFTLDALPGKQMAIDQEYSAGQITEEEATRRKAELQGEVEFYGAMDGAGKFVQGNVTAGILITVINIIGGLIVGITIRGESFDVALSTYISLTIGDGLASQFPALLISTATGIIVTRSTSTGSFGSDVSREFANQSRVYWIAAVFLLVLSFLPGFPWYVTAPFAFVAGFLGYRLSRRDTARAQASAKPASAKRPESPVDVSPVAPLDPISLELGYALVPLVDKDQGADLLERITKIRRETALDLGLVVPPIRIVDNLRLEPSEYCVKIRGVEVGRGQIRMGRYLSINPGGTREDIAGEDTVDPAFGLSAKWITEGDRERAERAGYTVVDPPSVIATHLTELLKRHAHEILGRQEVKAMLDALREDYSAVVEDVRNQLNLGQIQKVLQHLLEERVSIRDLVSVLEALADFGAVSKDSSFLTEKARQALGRQITGRHADRDGTLTVFTLEQSLEKAIIDSRVETTGGVTAALRPDVQRRFEDSVVAASRRAASVGLPAIVLCQEAARPLVKSALRRRAPDIVVLSVPEISAEAKVESLGEIALSSAAA